MPLLAGKPPFATDDPDSIFEEPVTLPRPRVKPVDETAPGGARESAYNTLDAYFTANDPRASGVGDIGLGLMNAADSDYDDSSDDETPPPKILHQNVISPADKHRALFEAAIGSSKPDLPPTQGVDAGQPSLPPVTSGIDTHSSARHPQPVIHTHHDDQYVKPLIPSGQQNPFSHKGLSTHPQALGVAMRPPLVAPAPAYSRPPQPAFMQPPLVNMHSSSTSFVVALPSTPRRRTPQPLPPPQTPILPVFIRPKENSNITFDEKVNILRGNSEETFLPRGAGGKGDDFWRRFSMVAREEARTGAKKSAWLKMTESGSTRLATWVWLIAIFILLAIGASIGVGWFFTHNKPASQPVAFGGSADETSGGVRAPTSTTSITPTIVTAAPVPTNTANNNKRLWDDITSSASAKVLEISIGHRRSFH